MVSSYQGQAKAETNQGPVVLGVFIISMTLSIFVYLSIIWSILRLCSEFRAFNGILHCFFTLQWYPATKDRPRLTQTKNQWSLVSYHINIYMTLSVIFYLSVILSILRICSEFGAFNGLLHCFFFASVVSSYQLPRTGQGGRKPRTSGPWCLGQWSVEPIVKPAVFFFFGHETC